MSLAENYEKTALGVAGFAVVAVAAMIFTTGPDVEEDFASLSGKRGSGTDAPQHQRAKGTLASLSSPKALPLTQQGNRAVRTFTSMPLFVKPDGEALDVLAPGSTDVHDGIPNLWWAKYGLDMGFEDSPDRDADGDGFTNREEFDDKTNPIVRSSHPPLINKLQLARVENDPFLLTFNSSADPTIASPRVTYVDGGRKQRKDAFNLKAGDTFPDDGKYAGVFKFIGTEKKVFQRPNNGGAVEINVAIFEDQRPNMDKARYEVLEQRHPVRRRKGFEGGMRSAVFTLEALDFKGQEFTVKQGTNFSLPAGAEEKPFKVVSIDANKKVTITGPDLEAPLEL